MAKLSQEMCGCKYIMEGLRNRKTLKLEGLKYMKFIRGKTSSKTINWSTIQRSCLTRYYYKLCENLGQYIICVIVILARSNCIFKLSYKVDV